MKPVCVNWHTRHVCRQVNFCDGGVRFMHAHPQFGNILCGALLPSVMRRESQLGVLPVVKDSI